MAAAPSRRSVTRKAIQKGNVRTNTLLSSSMIFPRASSVSGLPRASSFTCSLLEALPLALAPALQKTLPKPLESLGNFTFRPTTAQELNTIKVFSFKPCQARPKIAKALGALLQSTLGASWAKSQSAERLLFVLSRGELLWASRNVSPDFTLPRDGSARALRARNTDFFPCPQSGEGNVA